MDNKKVTDYSVEIESAEIMAEAEKSCNIDETASRLSAYAERIHSIQTGKNEKSGC